MNEKRKYSVLMSVYYKEKAAQLKAAMGSMWDQTISTDDFVLVCDGPLTVELDTVINEMEHKHPELTVVRLERNSGLGNALNIGLEHCKNELVARMDSDDISRLDRCEKQLKVFSDHPNIGICSGTVEEFCVSTNEITARRILPESSSKIMLFSKHRNPFNHPCVMFKKSEVMAAGGYKDLYLLEDYYLWYRMLQKEVTGYNISEPLLWMRTGPEMYRRRAGKAYALSQYHLFKEMRRSGYITFSQYIMNISTRWIASFVPNRVRMILYNTLLR